MSSSRRVVLTGGDGAMMTSSPTSFHSFASLRPCVHSDARRLPTTRQRPGLRLSSAALEQTHHAIARTAIAIVKVEDYDESCFCRHEKARHHKIPSYLTPVKA